MPGFECMVPATIYFLFEIIIAQIYRIRVILFIIKFLKSVNNNSLVDSIICRVQDQLLANLILIK